MDFQILGPLRVRVGSDLVSLPGRRMPKLLAVLLVNRDDALSLDRLIDAVWDNRPPPTAKRQIQNCVSLLRRRVSGPGAADPIEVFDGGGSYRLRVADADVDARLFPLRCAEARRSVAHGDAIRAARQFRAALGLWRGPALAGLSGPVIESAAAGLEEQRLVAIEDRMDVELALGHGRSMVGELAELVAANPLREHLVGQLMLSCYQADYQAEALQAFQRLRRLLAEELGVDPGERLLALYTEILTGTAPTTVQTPRDPAPDRADSDDAAPEPVPGWPVPSQLPADLATFTGRAEQLKALDELASQAARGGAGVIAAIWGMAGVGKTTLAVHWGHRAADHFPDGQLYVNLRGFDTAGNATSPVEAVRGLLGALAVPPERLPADPDAQTALYRSMVAGKRILVMLDNARDAQHVRSLLPGTSGAMTVVTSRNRLTSLVAVDGAVPCQLGLLTRAEAHDLLMLRLGAQRVIPERDATESIIVACGRLPLALGIAAARAQESDRPLGDLAAEMAAARGRLDALDGGDAVSRLRVVFSWSYATLTPPAARLFRLLGRHPGPEIGVAAAAALVGLPDEETRRSLSELSRAHLITELTTGRYSCHDLLRIYAEELAEACDPADGRAATARLLGYYTHTAHAAARLLTPRRDPMPLPLGPATDGCRPRQFSGTEAAMAWLVTEHPVLLAVLRAAADGGDPRCAWQLAWCLDTFQDWRGHWHDLADAWRIALPVARRLGDGSTEGYVHRRLALADLRLGRYADAHAHQLRALDLFASAGNGVGRADTHYDLAHLLWRQGRQGPALEHSRLALGLYEAAGHPQGRARALNAVGWCHAHLGDHAAALAHCEQALDVLRRLGDRYGLPHTLDSIGFAQRHLGRYPEAVASYQAAVDGYRDLGDRYGEATTLTRLGDSYDAAGDPGAARDAWQHALDLLDDLRHADAAAVRARLSR